MSQLLPPPLPGYKLVFEDHFDDQLDENKWTKIDGNTSPSGWFTCFSTDNSYTENGNYVAKIDATGCPGDPARHIKSGGIMTKDAWLYGYFEIRAKLVSVAGINCAFWPMRTDGIWPPEIDIVETAGYTDQRHTLHYAIHYDTDKKTKSGYYVSKNYSDDYHIYGCEWTPTEVRYYMDGVLKGTLPLQESMKAPMGVRLTIHKGWGADNYPAEADLPRYMLVDYLRVYEKQPSNTLGNLVIVLGLFGLLGLGYYIYNKK